MLIVSKDPDGDKSVNAGDELEIHTGSDCDMTLLYPNGKRIVVEIRDDSLGLRTEDNVSLGCTVWNGFHPTLLCDCEASQINLKIPSSWRQEPMLRLSTDDVLGELGDELRDLGSNDAKKLAALYNQIVGDKDHLVRVDENGEFAIDSELALPTVNEYDVNRLAADLLEARQETTLADISDVQWSRICNRIANALHKQHKLDWGQFIESSTGEKCEG